MRRSPNLQMTSVFGAELKKCKGLCANYLERRDHYEKRVIFMNLKCQMWFEIHKIMPLPLVFRKLTKKYVFVRVAFGPNRPFQ